METGLVEMIEGKEIDVGLADLSYTYSKRGSSMARLIGICYQ